MDTARLKTSEYTPTPERLRQLLKLSEAILRSGVSVENCRQKTWHSVHLGMNVTLSRPEVETIYSSVSYQLQGKSRNGDIAYEYRPLDQGLIDVQGSIPRTTELYFESDVSSLTQHEAELVELLQQAPGVAHG